ncbi:MAG: hypothetical protein LBC76_10185 [Treponema sp.]|jgi:hypothetical protein|nr:hypothetical protein [Treponema sp.]
MVNKKFWLGMLTMVLVFGMSVVGCDDDSTNDPSNDPIEDPLKAGLYLKSPPILKNDTPIAEVDANDIAAAITYINANPETYTLLIDNDVDLEPQSLDKANVKLTIIGIGSERKIKLSENGQMFSIGASGQTGIELTLGNNITLVGRSSSGNGNENNNDRIIQLNFGNSFTMLDGSKITGNTCQVDPASTNYLSAAVYVMGNSNFTIKGGTITGNAISGAASSQGVSGGLYVGTGCSAILEGGSITGNTGGLGDVLLSPAVTSFTFSKTSVVGELTMNTTSATVSTITITVAQDWTGNVGKLNLRGGSTTMATAVSYWEGRTILTGDSLTTARVNKITLGNFISSATSYNTADINATHKIENSGENIGKLVKKQ